MRRLATGSRLSRLWTQRSRPRNDLCEVVGFADVLVGARADPADAAADLGLGREQHDRDSALVRDESFSSLRKSMPSPSGSSTSSTTRAQAAARQSTARAAKVSRTARYRSRRLERLAEVHADGQAVVDDEDARLQVRALPSVAPSASRKRRRDLLQRQESAPRPQHDGLPRHAEDDRGCLVLGDGRAAGPPDREQALRSVPAHAGEQAAAHWPPISLRQRLNSTSTDGRQEWRSGSSVRRSRPAEAPGAGRAAP